MRRNFDVCLSKLGAQDLFAEDKQHRREIVRVLQRLLDEDLYGCHAVPAWPRGPRGSWVFFKCSGWTFLAQWDQGNAALWPVGLGRGTFTIEAIVPEGYVAQVLRGTTDDP